VDGATEVPRGSVVNVTFSKDMDPATIVSPATSFSLTAGAAVDGTVSYDAGTRTATFTPDDDLDWNTVYTATVSTGARATDGLALQLDKTWTFTTVVDVKPVVSNTDPASGMVNVLPEATITATFSKPMNSATITDSTFFVEDSSGAVAGALDFPAGNQVRFTPAADLEPGMDYTVTIVGQAPGVKDTDGLSMAADKVWSFRISNRPAVIAVSPPAGAIGVAMGANITATFSKDIDGATIEGDLVVPSPSFTVRDSAGTVVPGTVEYDSLTFTATFNPEQPLSYSGYTVTITTAVQDPDGIAMAAPGKTWSFTTVPEMDEPRAVRNRIVPGGNQQVFFFLTEPPKGPADRVTVQVFSTSGRRVATLVDGQPYSSIPVPFTWDGRNDAGQKLGPGMYFVQVRATNYKRTLQVMIVR
jgi:hypothetical protein